MLIPVSAGIVAGRGIDGLFIGVGGFIVASTDTGTGYRPRAVVLALTTFGVASGYLAGAWAGHMLWLASVLLAVILFGVGLAQASGERAAAIATMVAVGLIVGVFLPSTFATDLRATTEIGTGGLWALLLCLWRSPLHRHGPAPAPPSPSHMSVAGALGVALASLRRE
jgi:hypothetical protein